MTAASPAFTAVPMLEVVGLCAGYGHIEVLRDVNLRVQAGTVTAIIGPNGAGKTTLFRAASGLLRTTRGRVMLEGHDVTKAPPHVRVQRGLCHIPEGRGIYRSLTVRENIEIQAPKNGKEQAIDAITASFPVLGTRLGQLAGTMSGGEQQMLAMGAAYARNPRLILVDEPSLGLAPLIVDQIFEFLAGVAASGTTLVIVDQFVTRALEIAESAYVLRRGAIDFAGDPKELMAVDAFQHLISPGGVGDAPI